MRSRHSLIALAALAALAIPSSVEAHGAQPFVFTNIVQNSVTVPFVGCSGEVEGIVTVDFRDVFHITDFGDGHVNVSGSNQGTFDYVPFVGAPSSGHYRNGFHENHTPNSSVQHSVFTGAGRDADGNTDSFNVREHVTYANGEVRVAFSAGCD